MESGGGDGDPAGVQSAAMSLEEVHELAADKRSNFAEQGVDDEEAATDDFLLRSTAVKRATLKSQNLSDGDPAAGTAITAQAAIRAAAVRAGLSLVD